MAVEAWTKRWLKRSATVLLSCVLVACAAPPAPSAGKAGSLEAGVQRLTDDLLAQAGPTVLDRMATRRVVLDPFLDAQTGQETTATRQAAQLLIEQLQSRNSFLRVQPFRADSVDQAEYLITGALRPATEGPSASAKPICCRPR